MKKETAIDIYFRKMILECTFDTNRNIYDNCKLIEKDLFKYFYGLGIMNGSMNIKDFNKEEGFEYWYEKTFKI